MESWVVELLNRGTRESSSHEMVLASSQRGRWPLGYLVYLFSGKVSAASREALALALAADVRDETSGRGRRPSEMNEELLPFLGTPSLNPGQLYLAALYQLLVASYRDVRAGKSDHPVRYFFPALADPVARLMIAKRRDLLGEFISTFGNTRNRSSQILVNVIRIALGIDSESSYSRLVRLVHRDPEVPAWLYGIVTSLVGLMPKQLDKSVRSYAALTSLVDQMVSPQEFERFLDEVSSLVNLSSDSIANHAHRLWLWISSGCDESIRAGLDSDIAAQVEAYLGARGMPLHVLELARWGISIEEFHSDLGFMQMIASLAVNTLRSGRGDASLPLWPLQMVTRYRWSESRPSAEIALAEELGFVFDMLASQALDGNDVDGGLIEAVYWATASGGALTEERLASAYEIGSADPRFLTRLWLRSDSANAVAHLTPFLRSKRDGVARVAALSLVELVFSADPPFRSEELVDDADMLLLRNRIWRLILDGAGVWRTRLIRALAHFPLDWREKSGAISDLIRAANSDSEWKAWARVIEGSEPRTPRDMESLRRYLIRVLGNRSESPRVIRRSALGRLHAIEASDQPVRLDEGELNLPLARRR
jgi:hypothetical protein